MSPIANIVPLFTLIEKYKDSKHIFRGQSIDWPLVPKAGRPEYKDQNDINIFSDWKRRAIFYIDKNNINDVDFLAIAQHTGLPTRLLDWSLNPLIALFFACVENKNEDGVFYALEIENYLIEEKNDNPYDFNNLKIIQPKTTHSRMLNQLSYFTIHPNPSLELSKIQNKVNLDKIIISSKIKNEVLKKIHFYGINYASIFPDLEGLSKHLCKFYEK